MGMSSAIMMIQKTSSIIPKNNMFITHSGSYPIKRISSNGVVNGSYAINGSESVFDGTDMWVLSTLNNSISKITPAGNISTYSLGSGSWRGLVFAGGYIWTGNGTSVYKIDLSGVKTFVGDISSGNIQGFTFDGTNIWCCTSTGIVSKITQAGSITNYNILSGLNPVAMTFDGGNTWTANASGNSVSKITSAGVATTYALGAGNIPVSIAFDRVNIWTANSTGDSVSKITSSGVVTSYSIGSGVNPKWLAFDGYHMWTANGNNTTSKVLVSSGGVIGNYSSGSTSPTSICFDAVLLSDWGYVYAPMEITSGIAKYNDELYVQGQVSSGTYLDKNIVQKYNKDLNKWSRVGYYNTINNRIITPIRSCIVGTKLYSTYLDSQNLYTQPTKFTISETDVLSGVQNASYYYTTFGSKLHYRKGICVDGSDFYLAGGCTQGPNALEGSVYKYSVGGTLSQITTLPTPRRYPVMTIFNGELWVMSGSLDPNTSTYLWMPSYKVEVYNFSSNSWRTMNDAPYKIVGVVVANGTMYAEGAEQYSSGNLLKYDTATDTWNYVGVQGLSYNIKIVEGNILKSIVGSTGEYSEIILT